ncbi:penicillin-binding protein [Rhodococcus sp. 06-412-2C]|uniref:D-alanyl-D-alanine carboxypeptidase family protein n=1 Tax=unclassified Rhodococcus (in: high G+C Gram-positive bacteria) TaxID=192944 RepID=UPI000B9B95F6|nr:MULTISPECIES: D-alanyl-D-alanine carboxypeptidase family protein [unclassified Rhodococcus (in: high G+C Gram-positive bacteria)]OZC86529.1 penicillin-binding protein [Rhodococcus sp. 06-412-2C]OZD02228.1 penicillin-binding protein [Rhodococcus sp. 06-412-2B]
MKRIRSFAAVCAVSIALVGIGAGPAMAQPAAEPPVPTTTPPFTTPDTDSCPYAASPPPAIDLSEVPAPGSTAPQPLPIPADAVGGDRLAECGVVLPDGAPPLPADISATGFVVADMDSGAVLAAKDPHGRYRPASTIKTLLALVALDELNPSTQITATAEDAEAEGSAVGIGKNGVYTNLQLMQGLVMASGNDAAHALSTQLGGDAATVDKMNAKAAELGALDTRTATPSGLDGPGMASSAYDLALIFREAMRNPTFAQLISTETVQFPGYPKDPAIPEDQDRPGFALSNDNQLLYNYEGALGGKTGYTDDARQTFVAGAERNGRRLVVTIMKGDVLPIRPWEQAARLLDYGFALDPNDTVGELVEPQSTAAVTSTRASEATPTLAQPPASASGSGSRQSEMQAQGDTVVRISIGVIGAIVVIGLLWGARRLSRNR